MDPRQILHPVAMGLTLAEEVLLCEVVVGSGDEVRSTSITFLGVGKTSMTLSSPPWLPLS